MYEYLDRRYALALYEVAESKGKVDEYLETLRYIVDLFKNNKDLKELVSHTDISSAKTKKVLKQIFAGKVDEEILSFLLLLVDKGRIQFLDKKFLEMQKIYNERNSILIAEVTSAIPLNEEEEVALKEKLHEKYNKNIVIKNIINPSIIGGIYLKVGDTIIDGTIKKKLKDMKQNMLKGIEVR